MNAYSYSIDEWKKCRRQYQWRIITGAKHRRTPPGARGKLTPPRCLVALVLIFMVGAIVHIYAKTLLLGMKYFVVTFRYLFLYGLISSTYVSVNENIFYPGDYISTTVFSYVTVVLGNCTVCRDKNGNVY